MSYLLVDLSQVDHFLHCALCDKAVHPHISTLANAEGSVHEQSGIWPETLVSIKGARTNTS